MRYDYVPPMGKDFGRVKSSEVESIRQKSAKLSDLNNQLISLETQIKQIEGQIKFSQESCQHNWTNPIECSRTTQGYQTHGDDPEKFGGADFRGPAWIPGTVTVWYERDCPKCGLVERTNSTKPSNEVTPVFH